MQISTYEHGAALVIVVPCVRLDRTVAVEIKEKLLALTGGRAAVVLDLTAVRYLDFFGTDLVLEAVRRCPGKTCLGGVDDSIKNLLTMTLASEVVATFPSVESAIEHCLSCSRDKSSSWAADNERGT